MGVDALVRRFTEGSPQYPFKAQGQQIGDLIPIVAHAMNRTQRLLGQRTGDLVFNDVHLRLTPTIGQVQVIEGEGQTNTQPVQNTVTGIAWTIAYIHGMLPKDFGPSPYDYSARQVTNLVVAGTDGDFSLGDRIYHYSASSHSFSSNGPETMTAEHPITSTVLTAMAQTVQAFK